MRDRWRRKLNEPRPKAWGYAPYSPGRAVCRGSENRPRIKPAKKREANTRISSPRLIEYPCGKLKIGHPETGFFLLIRERGEGLDAGQRGSRWKDRWRCTPS
jgi:hypothetical protein